MNKIDRIQKSTGECLLDIEKNTDFLYYVGQTYEKIENKEYVGIVIQQIIDAIEGSCRDIKSLIKADEKRLLQQEIAIMRYQSSNKQ